MALELGNGEVQGEQRVLAGLGLPLGVARGGRLDPRVGRESDEEEDDEGQQRDYDEQRESAARIARRKG